MEFIYELITFSSEYPYPFVFLIIFIFSIIPLFTPPTWIVVVSAYSLDDQLDPFLLSAIAATAAIIGRLILLQLSTMGRKGINDYRKISLEELKNYLEKTRYGYLFAVTTLPNNMLFISFGLMNAKSLGITAEFWIGRFIVYLGMISLSKYFVDYFKEILNSYIQTLLVLDILGIIMTLSMLLIY